MGAIQQILIGGSGGAAGFDLGFNFRSTAGYVTDGVDETYVLPTDLYPTTRDGVTFGWVVNTQGVAAANRNSGIDQRLAGINFVVGGAVIDTYFRVDLPSAGNCQIHIALGDASFPQNNMMLVVKDTTTTLFTIPNSGTAAAHFLDANAVDLTTVTWPTTTSPRAATFATTQLRLYLGDPGFGDPATLAHLRIVKS